MFYTWSVTKNRGVFIVPGSLLQIRGQLGIVASFTLHHPDALPPTFRFEDTAMPDTPLFHVNEAEIRDGTAKTLLRISVQGCVAASRGETLERSATLSLDALRAILQRPPAQLAPIDPTTRLLHFYQAQGLAGGSGNGSGKAVGRGAGGGKGKRGPGAGAQRAGVQNVGNTCFLGALLQLLAASSFPDALRMLSL